MRRRRTEDLAIDLTPMIDCVFLLLAFFLVSTVFKTQEMALLLNLPKSEVAGQRDVPHELFIELSDTAVAFNGKKTELKVLGTQLDTVKDKRTPVKIRIDQGVPYSRVSELLDLLQARQLTDLALMKAWEPRQR